MIRALLRLFRPPHDFSSLEPIQPRVTPDPEAVEALERKRAELAYRPENGFLADISAHKVSGVESRHAIKQMVDSRKGATCEMSVAGLALPVVQQPAAAVTRGEKMERLIGGNSDPLAREPDKKRRLVMPPRRSSARPHFVSIEGESA